MTLNRKKSRIIVIGANFAGLSAASKLSKCHDVTIIDAKQDFQWTPNIHEILSDVKKETSLNLNLATIITRLGHHFINQTVSSIDGALQTVTLDDKQILNYDVLLIASGHSRSTYGIKGASKYAHGFRSADNVIQIHHDIEAVLNSNKHLININIVGGGFTGVEVLGELLRKYASTKQLHFNVIDNASRLVQALPERLSDDVISQCKNYQVSFHFNKKITEVKKSSIHFDDNKSIDSDVTIWSAGTKLPEYLDGINTQATSNGLAVNRFLQTKEFSSIFVAGDSATLPNALPKQASIALDMGVHAAININRFCAKKSLKPFKVSVKPVLLSLGDINTYFIQGKLVLASPLLAAGKEAVYQFYMARLSTLLPIEQRVLGIADRITLSTEKLLLAEILKLRPRVLFGRSKVL
ncbi:FAD-dependent oxidoreductase [Paraglaciecola sp.]|nr:FAD-dependent oxidoreductase [Paraglaciecola sp.]MDB4281532.1 FAD-dependent oxidoreductase [Paraglaciecola sp.]